MEKESGVEVGDEKERKGRGRDEITGERTG